MNTKRRQEKISRNDSCYCGSNLKYKKCCLKKTAPSSDLKELNEDKVRKIQVSLKETASQYLRNQEDAVFYQDSDHVMKMSQVIIDFADDLLQKMHTRSQKKKVLSFACLAWNMGVLAGIKGTLPDLDNAMVSMDIQDKEGIEVCKYILSTLINKKLTEYADVNRIIMSYEITDEGENDFRIDIASMMSKKKRSDLSIEQLDINKRTV